VERQIDNETLSRKTQQFGALVLETRQISSRLRKILPSRLKEIERKYRRDTAAGRAGRLALADKSYEAFIEEFATVSSEAHLARIQFETHCLLIDARRSMRSYRNAQNNNLRQ